MFLLKYKHGIYRNRMQDRYVLYTGDSNLTFDIINKEIRGEYHFSEIKYLESNLYLASMPYNRFIHLSPIQGTRKKVLEFIKHGFVYRVKYNGLYLYDYMYKPVCISQVKFKQYNCPKQLKLYLEGSDLNIF